MIEELVSRVFATRNAAHLANWATKSYAEHMALGSFYGAIIEKLDAIVEVHQGAFGLMKDIPAAEQSTGSISDHLASEVVWIQDNRSKLAGGVRALENLLDDLVGEYLQTFYKLANLS